jgi:hypothetical protein
MYLEEVTLFSSLQSKNPHDSLATVGHVAVAVLLLASMKLPAPASSLGDQNNQSTSRKKIMIIHK